MRRMSHGKVLLVMAGTVLAATAHAQLQGEPLAPCPAPAEVRASDLYGLWHFSLWPDHGQEADAVSRGAMLFEAHPDYPDGVRGELRRSRPHDEVRAQVSGDVTGGEFNLDESDDGVSMSAVWTGALSPTDCRLDISGSRRAAEGQRPSEGSELRFRLRKVP